MKAVLGLGNPGPRYAATRHNIGWLVLDAVAEALRGEFVPGKGEYYEAHVRYRGREAVLVKPTTWMNNSGIAARQIIDKRKVTPADLLVVVDEIQFPTGRIQVKSSGSSGGHNGLESLIYHLGTSDIPRLRCGVGNDFGPGEMADYVLSSFPLEEAALVEAMIISGRDAVLMWIAEGTARAMNVVNRAGETEKGEAAKGRSGEGESV